MYKKLAIIGLVATTLLTTSGLYFHIPHATAVSTAGLSLQPAAVTNGNNSTSLSFQLTAGGKTTAAVTLSNHTATYQPLSLYAVDATIGNAGQLDCPTKTSPSSLWVEPVQKAIILPPHGTATSSLVLNAPKAAMAGEHQSCLIAQTTPLNGVVHRLALRVATIVPGTLHSNTTIAAVQPRTDGSMSVAMHNDGNVSSETELNIRLQGILGFSIATVHTKLPIYPNTTASLRVELPNTFWGGLYRITTEVDSVNNPLQTSSASRMAFFWPTTAGLTVECIFVLAIAYISWYVRGWMRLERRWKLNRRIYVVREHDTLLSIARSRHMSIPDLIRLNGLLPAFQLRRGRNLKVLALRRTSTEMRVRRA